MALIHNSVVDSKLVVGVIAGTPIDTRFGVNYLDAHQIKAVGRSISETPQQQTEMQALNRDELTARTLGVIRELQQAGVNAIMIYCNSLSGAIDLDGVRKQIGIPLVSPLDVYKDLIGKYRKFGLLAAKCQSCANIERLII